MSGQFDRHARKFYDLYDMKEGRWPRSVIGAADKHMTGAEKSNSRVGSWRTRAGVCCVGESGV